MADLDELLLKAAGRTDSRNHHPPPLLRNKQNGSYSDDGSDSKNEDSDDDDDRPYSIKKPSGSQVPLKKRGDPTDRDDSDRSSQDGDDSNRERDSDNDSIGSDLYKDEDDRKKLEALTELEREMILEDRATKRSDRDLTEKLKKRKGPERKGNSPPKTHTRNMRSKAQRAGALDELVKRRRDAAKGSGGRYSPVKRRTFTSAALSSPSRSESGSQSDDGESTGDGGMVDSDDDKNESKVPTFEDVKEITIRRSKLSKWFMEPFFDELIIGCFVRVGIGRTKLGRPIYRLCMVRNVDASDPDRQYKLDNKNTHKYLNVTWGNESSAARWQMAMISDSPPIKEEFDLWVKEVDRSSGHMPSKDEVLEKKDAIKKTNSFVYSAETVKQMLQEKKSATRRPLNVAAEKDRLRKNLESARESKDEAEVERITTKIQELEATQKSHAKDSKAVKLAEMNRKNRVDNFKNASGLKPVNTGLRAGEAGYDPFSRRWTRSRNYYVGKATETANAVEATSVEASSVEATVAALDAAAGAGKLVDTSAPVDQGTESNLLHNFELPISLAVLQKFGGHLGAQAGFMARKQRIEATVGVQVPNADGRRHVLTLTVSDYKRRRGLL